MNCPNCGGGDHRVLRTDAQGDRIMRTRECPACGKRWKTAEVDTARLARADEVLEVLREVRRVAGDE